MAIYQAPRKRWRLAVACAVIGALVGLGVGIAGGGGSDDPLAAIRQLDTQLEEAAAPLDVLVIHGQADTGSSGDARIVTDALARTEQRFGQVRDLVATINADAVEAFDDHVDALRKLAADGANADEIASAADELADLLRGIVRT
jgi:hypothetical protein